MVSPLERAWYGHSRWVWLLLPLSWAYGTVVFLRRLAYRLGLAQSTELPVPVLVVGNFTVGGTGKTPLVTALAHRLRNRGVSPGIVTRGYGGKADDWPRLVSESDDPALCGDEAVLMARRAGCPVAASPRRADAARLLLEQGVNFILADDGLQHLALDRDAEIAVQDASRSHGNGWLLPAGPLREHPRSRAPVDIEMVNGINGDFWLEARAAYPLGRADAAVALEDWSGKSVYAVAAIGNPERFFATLRGADIDCEPRPFPDHHAFRQADFQALTDKPIFMTEKDAVKCESLGLQQVWVVPVEIEFTPDAARRVDALLDRLLVRATQ